MKGCGEFELRKAAKAMAEVCLMGGMTGTRSVQSLWGEDGRRKEHSGGRFVCEDEGWLLPRFEGRRQASVCEEFAKTGLVAKCDGREVNEGGRWISDSVVVGFVEEDERWHATNGGVCDDGGDDIFHASSF